jgi:uncharacterized protein YacL
MAPVDIVLGVAGLIVGLAVAWLASVPLRLLEPVWLSLVTTVLLFLMMGWARRSNRVSQEEGFRAPPPGALRDR